MAVPLGDDGLGNVLGAAAAAVLLHHQLPDLLRGGTGQRSAAQKAQTTPIRAQDSEPVGFFLIFFLLCYLPRES